MQDNEFFVVDMASCSSTGEVINSITLALEALNHTGKKIVLKLNDSHFNQSQMLSIQSLIASYGCILDTVETTNPETAQIVENMNIYVQEPIEKRIENKHEGSERDGFETFSMTKPNDDIALKDVNGLHFEADLDAIQAQQSSIDISSDLESAGINPRSDFQSIEEQVIQKYSKPEDALSSIDKFSEFSENIDKDIKEATFETSLNSEAQESETDLAKDDEIKSEEETEIPQTDDYTLYQQEEPAQESALDALDTLYGNNTEISVEERLEAEDDLYSDAQSKESLEDTPSPVEENIQKDLEYSNDKIEKNSISVYKKAYDEFAPDKEDWEEVDFYETPTSDPVVSDTKNTVYINQTLRSGQILESDGNVVIIGDCHPGSEIRAVGDITVWGVLSGIAHAGYKGNINAKVRALKMNAVQLRIGSCYSRRPDSTNIPYIIKSSVFTPEEARAVDNEIMLFKINQN